MKFHFWYTVLSIFFIAVSGLGYLWLAANGRLVSWMPLSDFFLIALAVMRLIRLFTYDIITAFFRNWFVGAPSDSFLGTLGTLVNCPWCTGLWFSSLMTFFYFATPVAWYVIFILALSSLATFFQVLTNFIGWSAEVRKREAQS